MDKLKPVEFKNQLAEDKQRDLYCMAWHLQSLIEDAKNKKIASFSRPCETCERRINYKCNLDFYNKSKILTELTGVTFSPILTAEKAASAEKRLSEGKATINQIRGEYGLPPLEDELADKLLTTKE